MDGATVSFLFLQFRNKTKKKQQFRITIQRSKLKQVEDKKPNIIQKIDLCQPFVVVGYTSDSISQSTVMVI